MPSNLGWIFLKYFFIGLWTYDRPFILLIIGIFTLRVVLGVRRARRLSRAGFDEIDTMSGVDFERFLSSMFRRLGYSCEMTATMGDYGGDLVLRKGGVKTIVQAKRWKRSVGVKAVQEVVAAKGYYGASSAIVVTNSTFTRQAEELARANGVETWDRARLAQKLLESRKSGDETAETVVIQPLQQQPLMTEARPGPPICVTCGKAVSPRVAQYCASKAAVFDGKIYCYDHQRGRSSLK